MGVDWERESWMMDAPLPTTSARDLGTLGLTSDSGMADLQPSPSPSQPAASNTYALFENQSIWSLNNSGSESSNLLSWAVLGAAEHQQQQGKSTDE